jgi:zinc and cadmium transporter
MAPAVLLVIYCCLIVLASLTGGWLPSILRLSHLRMQLLMSLVGGMMIGVACLHLLPQAVAQLNDLRWLSSSLLVGVLSMLFLLRFGHVHHHGDPVTFCDHAAHSHDHDHSHDHSHDHDHDHSHDHDHLHDHDSVAPAVAAVALPTRHRLSWVGLFLGLALHTVFDGVALGASVVAEAGHSSTATLTLFGLGTFLAVVLHKPLDSMSITSVMNAGGWHARSQAIINGAFALACPAGAIVFWFGTSALESSNYIVGCALAFSAGAFLCIALTDLIPEALNHQHDRLKLTSALLLGSVLAIGIELLPGHNHSNHQTLPPTTQTVLPTTSPGSDAAFSIE